MFYTVIWYWFLLILLCIFISVIYRLPILIFICGIAFAWNLHALLYLFFVLFEIIIAQLNH